MILVSFRELLSEIIPIKRARVGSMSVRFSVSLGGGREEGGGGGGEERGRREVEGRGGGRREGIGSFTTALATTPQPLPSPQNYS